MIFCYDPALGGADRLFLVKKIRIVIDFFEKCAIIIPDMKEDFRMKKESYERLEMDIITFRTEDVLLVSNPDDEYEAERTMVQLPLI